MTFTNRKTVMGKFHQRLDLLFNVSRREGRTTKQLAEIIFSTHEKALFLSANRQMTKNSLSIAFDLIRNTNGVILPTIFLLEDKITFTFRGIHKVLYFSSVDNPPKPHRELFDVVIKDHYVIEQEIIKSVKENVC